MCNLIYMNVEPEIANDNQRRFLAMGVGHSWSST